VPAALHHLLRAPACRLIAAHPNLLRVRHQATSSMSCERRRVAFLTSPTLRARRRAASCTLSAHRQDTNCITL
jgi:hypothetical protein